MLVVWVTAEPEANTIAVGRPWLLLVNQVLLLFQSVTLSMVAVGVVVELLVAEATVPLAARSISLTFGTPCRVVNL